MIGTNKKELCYQKYDTVWTEFICSLTGTSGMLLGTAMKPVGSIKGEECEKLINYTDLQNFTFFF